MSRSLIALVATAFVCGLVVVQSASANTPRHPPGAFYFGPEPIWTDGTTSDIFQPLSAPLPSSSLVNARIFMEITEGTGGANLRTRPALRYSNDGVGWDAAVPIYVGGSYVSGNGVNAGTTWVDLSALGTDKAWVQFGVQMHDNAQGNYEFAHAILIVEPKGN